MTLSRFMSGLLYVLFSIVFLQKNTMDAESTFWVLFGLLLPLSCVWFPKQLGDYMGGLEVPITNRSPHWLVMLMGWVLLILPMLFLF